MTEAIKQKEKSPLIWMPLIFILVGLIIFITSQQTKMDKEVKPAVQLFAINAQEPSDASREFPMKLWLTVIGGILILLAGKELYFALTSGSTEIQWITPTMLAIGLSLLTVIIIILEKYYPGWWSNLMGCKNGKLQLGALAVLFLAYYIMPGTGPTTISIGKFFIPIGIVIIIMMITITATNWKFETKKGSTAVPVAQSQFQIIPQVSKGWKVDSEGRLVAKLQPGEEEQRVFRISEGYSTPWFVLPPEKYRFRADYQQTVIVEEKGRDKKIVHPNDLDNRGITQGSRREFRFTALKGGAEIIITLRRI